MRIAVVILNWNGRSMLERFLPSLMDGLHAEAKVIVADNASTDDSVVFLQENFPEVERIVLDKNWGFAEGYNKALRQIAAEYYVLLNSDVEVTQGWLAPLLDFMDTHGEVAACQPKLCSEVEHGSFEYAGACGGFLDSLGYPFCRGRVFDTVEQDSGQYDTVADVLWATGACLFIRSRDYWAAGGFDGRFFAHSEEIDLCWRIRLQGKRIVCVPGSVVYHVGGGALPKSNPRKTFLNFRNNLTMLYKCIGNDRELRRVMRWRWFLDYLAAWQALLLKGNLGDFKAIYQARRAFRQWRGDFDAERAEIRRNSVQESVVGQQPYSILWQYYVRRRRKFSQLP